MIPGKLTPELQRTLAIAVPALILLLSATLIVPRCVSIWTVSRLAAGRRRQAAATRRQNRLAFGRQHWQRQAVLPQSRDEQVAFLQELNRIIAASQVRLVSFRPPAGTGGGAAGAPAAARPGDGSGPPVLPIAADVTVTGCYRDLVRFFSFLANADRLFAVENLQVRTEAYPRLSAPFRLIRYVTPTGVRAAARERVP